MLFPQIRFRRTAQIRIGVLIGLAIGVFASPLVSPQQRPSAQEKERKDVARRRIEWFYNQRAYPFSHIPSGARLKALRQLDEMLVREGKLVRNRDGTVAAPAEVAAAAAAAGANPWTAIGPQPTNSISFGSVSGRVTALAVDPTDANTVYLGGAQGGIWKTTDGGTNWTALTDGQPSLAIGSIAIDPNSCNPPPPAVGCQTIYVGTGEENFSIDSYYGAGVLKSTDGGNTWTQLGASVFVGPFRNANGAVVGGAKIGALAVSPIPGPNAGKPIVLAAVQIFTFDNTSGIYCSDDGGATWINVVPGAAATAVVFDPGGTIAYGALGRILGDPQNGIYKTTNPNQTCSSQVWNRLTSTDAVAGFPQTSLGRIELAFAPSTSGSTGVLYASIGDATKTSNTLLGMLKTTNGGNTWSPLTVPDYCQDQCWYDNVVRVHPNNPSVIYAGGRAGANSFIRSSDGGNTWSSASVGTNGVQLHVDQHAMAFGFSGATATKLYAGNDGGVWSTDVSNPVAALNWTNLNSTLNITQFYPGHSIHPLNPSVAFGGTQDNGTQKFTGTPTWQEVTCGDGGWTAIDPSVPSTVYAACADIDVLKSTISGDVGTFFSVSTNNGITPGDRHAFISPLVLDPSTPQRLYFGTFRVYQTTNGASSWTAVSNDLTGTGSGSSGPDVTTIAVAPSNSNVVYAGTGNGHVAVCQTAISASTACWNDVSAGLPNRVVTQIAVDSTDSTGKTAYAAFSGFSGCPTCDGMGHVFKTINAGAAWVAINGNLPDTPVNDIVVDPDDPSRNTLFVGTDIGVFMTSNANLGPATTWSPVSPASPGVPGLPRVAVLSLKLHEPSRTLRAATHGRGMWDLSLAGPDFSLSANPTSATVSPGGMATYTIAVTPQGGFNGTVVLSCTKSPAVITCSSFSPPSVTPPTNTSTVTLTAAANAVVPGAPLRRQGPRLLPIPWLLAIVLMLVASALAARLGKRRLALELPLALLFLLLLLKVAGCGGGGGGGSGPPAPRTYTVTVTGTSSSTPPHTTTLTLVVQ